MMKAFYSVRIWLLLSFSLGIANAQFLNWQYTELVADESRMPENPHSVLAADGSMHLTCWNKTLNQLLYGVQTANGWQWELPDPQTEAGYVSAVCVDAQNRVHVAYIARNSSGNAYVKYALRSANGWVSETIFPDSVLGKYGIDLDPKTRLVWSISIQTDANDNPYIAVFDGSVGSFSTCPYPIGLAYNSPAGNYDLSMRILRKNTAGQWIGYTPNVVANRSCLLRGDRFGEFCYIFPGINDSLKILTTSMHNHQQLLFNMPTDTLKNYRLSVLDEFIRNPLDSMILEISHFEGYGYIDGDIVGDSILYTVSGYSTYYSTYWDSRNRLVVTRTRLDSLHVPGYQPFVTDLNPSNRYLQTFTSVEALSPDSLYIVFYDTQTRSLRLGSSTNGGNTWAYSDIIATTVSTKTQLHATADSLVLVFHDSEKDGIFRATLPRSGNGTWQIRPIIALSARGHHLSSLIERNAGNDTLALVWVDEITQSIGFRQANNSIEMPDTAKAQEVSLLRLNADSLALIYGTVNPAALKMAVRTSTGWTSAVLENAVNPQRIQTKYINDTLHIVYYDGVQKYLKHLTWKNGVIFNAIADSAGATTGRQLDMIAHNNGLMVSYTADDSLRLAYWTAADGWEKETILQTGKPDGHALVLDTLGTPRIAWFSNSDYRIHFSEKIAAGWSNSLLPAPGGLPTETIHLLTDSKNRPWVFANLTTSSDDIYLFRRDAAGTWQQVGITNNPAEIARTFDVHLVEKDLYIVGRQNLPYQTGIGMLYAANGITTELADIRMFEQEIVLKPNPSAGDAMLQLTLPFSGSAEVRVLSLTGQVQSSQQIQLEANQLLEINLSRPQMPGCYLCQIICGDASVMKKWIVID